MTMEHGIALAVAVMALKAIAELAQVIKGLIDKRNGRPGEAVHGGHGLIEHRLRAIEDSLKGIKDSIHDIRDKSLMPIVTKVAVLEHRVAQLENH